MGKGISQGSKWGVGAVAVNRSSFGSSFRLVPPIDSKDGMFFRVQNRRIVTNRVYCRLTRRTVTLTHERIQAPALCEAGPYEVEGHQSCLDRLVGFCPSQCVYMGGHTSPVTGKLQEPPF